MLRPLALSAAWLGLSVVSLSLLTGCGGDGTVTVSGTVLIDGKPATKGSVRFVPDKSKGNTFGQEPAGMIGTDGKYTLSTPTGSGAPLGWYKVVVVSQDLPDSAKPNVTKSYVAVKYGNPDSSGLSVEVVRSAPTGAYDLKVTEK
jgi:hypothetical protein